jgi:two-component system sensor histidine kinase VicK
MQIKPDQPYTYIFARGEMADRIRAFDWETSSLGPISTWPAPLLATVNQILDSGVPMFIWWGPEFIQFYNDAYLAILGTDDSSKHPLALGQKGDECWHEIWPVIYPMLSEVLSTARSVYMEDQLLPIYRKGVLDEVYWTFSYNVVRDSEGQPAGILVICSETTNKVAYQHDIISQLTESNLRFKNLLHEATVGIIVLTGDELKVEIVNETYAELIGRSTKDLLGQPLFSVIPEAEADFRPVIDEVRLANQPVYIYDNPYMVYHEGRKIDGYLNVVYQPYHDTQTNLSGVMVVCHDVTEQVRSRLKVKKANELTNLAIEAARLGYWHLEPKDMTFVYNETFASLFGYEGKEKMTYEQMLNQITEDYRADIRVEVDRAIRTGGNYDVTFTQRRFNDDAVIWLRSIGKLTQDQNGEFTIFSGFVFDITEQKLEEERKNNFISMVSHELKTPITSLSAYLQVLEAKASKTRDNFTVNAVEKSIAQVKKMTAMINGFLNISRLESGKIYIDKERFDLAVLFRDIEAEFKATSSSHHISFHLRNPADVTADRDKISQVIHNFISNAIKYSPAGTAIRVDCILQNNLLQVSVKDEGAGITVGDKDKIFDRYFRSETAVTGLVSGFGIGLYLSAEIIRLHGGQIWVDNDLHGKGAVFHFSVPV